jgi:hypothetical protein
MSKRLAGASGARKVRNRAGATPRALQEAEYVVVQDVDSIATQYAEPEALL